MSSTFTIQEDDEDEGEDDDEDKENEEEESGEPSAKRQRTGDVRVSYFTESISYHLDWLYSMESDKGGIFIFFCKNVLYLNNS